MPEASIWEQTNPYGRRAACEGIALVSDRQIAHRWRGGASRKLDDNNHLPSKVRSVMPKQCWFIGRRSEQRTHGQTARKENDDLLRAVR
jgi:hypothetical protein